MRKLEPSAGRVARRMAALFVLCALIPVAATSLISYSSVHDALVAQRVALLRGTAAGYGTEVLERLDMLETLARSIGSDVRSGIRTFPTENLTPYFRGAVLLERPGARPLFGQLEHPLALGDLKPLQARLDSGAPALAIGPSIEERSAVWMLQQIGDAAAGPRYMALELQPAFLWATDRLPYLTAVCVLSETGAPINCSEPLGAEGLAAMSAAARGSNGDFPWEAGGSRYLSGYREVFLRAKFGADPWIVVASQPQAHALAPVEAVASLVFPVVLLGLLVAALLGSVQVRRTLRPLKELTEATKRLARRDFSARLPARSDDEFGVLSQAFNSMSQQLGRQFNAMQANSEINAVILSRMDLERVAQIVLERMPQLVAADRFSLLLAGANGEIFRHFKPNPAAAAPKPLLIAQSERARLLAAADGLAALSGIDEPHLFALPIVVAGELGGVLLVAYDTPRRPDEAETTLLRDLANRVAVALATSRRDEELYRRANYDSLTQLPNRLLGMDALSHAVSAAARDGRLLAVLFVDLDGFAAVNDSAGHAAGDQVLTQAASRLRACVRSSDIVARLGGDEFAVVLRQVREPQDAALVAKHAIEVLSMPYEVAQHSMFVSASVGIAMYPADAADAEELLRHADLAMYKAKHSGRRQFAFFEASMNAEVRQRVELESALRRALERDEFELHYQPQCHLPSGRIVGAEALIRWRHPTRGLVPPAQFVPFAETTGLIEEIGRWALAAAAAQYAAWQADGLLIEHVSVNVSPRQLQRPKFARVVREILDEARVAPAAMRLEITETAVLDQASSTSANLAALVELGTPLELDDFGSGYSSLAYLQRLPVATVKLDRAFIRTIERDTSAQAVVRAAIDMVHALGKTVVAEGVEESGQMEVLAGMKCDLMQGYLLSPPLSPAEFPTFIRARRAARVALLSR
jgi:diguanylate cyclase (GGDEF)-like protein